MTPLALALVLAAATGHATWNMLLKRAGGGPVFLWLTFALGLALYAPLAAGLVLIERPPIGLRELTFMLGSGGLHLGYFLLLERGYRAGDLSLVYPLARGTGPALATVAAIVFFAERPSPLALFGAILVACGLLVLSGPRRLVDLDAPRAAAAVGYALATGSFIAAYTLWDAHAVAVVAISPLLLEWASNAVRTALLAPLVARRPGDVASIWREHRTEVLGVAALSPLAYILVLSALVSTPVSYVSPARELSIVIGVAMGSWLLGEAAARRLPAAAMIVVGVTALALG
ncbi:MAG: EamA family transporter [Gaiellaceae bacterium]